MTEQSWLTSIDPQSMLEFLRGKITGRKIRLWACACCRQIGQLMTKPVSREAINIAEQYAEGFLSEDEREDAFVQADAEAVDLLENCYDYSHYPPTIEAEAEARAAAAAAWAVSSNNVGDVSMAIVEALGYVDELWAKESESLAVQADLLRHIVGNPFRTVEAPSKWPTLIVELARSVNAGQRATFALHDALLEGGHEDLARHFRARLHPRGCWAIDLILGRE